MMMKLSDEELTDEETYSDNDVSHCDSSVNSQVSALLDSEHSYHSNTSNKTKYSTSLFQRNCKVAKLCVFFAVILERMAYYSLLGNLASFVNFELGYTPQQSTITSFSFQGLTWITCLIGAFMGDVLLGRHKAIAAGLFFYIGGFIAVSFLALSTERCELKCGDSPSYILWFIFALISISLGEGNFKSNMSTFGADQVSDTNNNELRTFFHSYYWSINIGAFLGFSALTFLQQLASYFVGYVTASILLLLALLIFLFPGTRNYHLIPKRKSVLGFVAKICFNAKRKKNLNEFQHASSAMHWLDRAKTQYGGQYSDNNVEDVKQLFSSFTVLLFLIIYFACQTQVSSMFLVQGLHMKLISFDDNLSVPACWFSLFNIITVLCLVPFVNRFCYPYLDKMLVRCPPYILRMSIGMVLASAGMVSGGVVEYFRLKNSHHIENIINNNMTVYAKDMSIWYQVPQYGLIGLSEIFVIISGLEYAYCEAPQAMQSIVTGLFYLSNGMGALLAILIIGIFTVIGYPVIGSDTRKVKSFIPSLKDSRIDKYFYCLAVLNMLNLFVFVLVGMRKSKRIKKHQIKDQVSAYIKNSLDSSIRNTFAS